MLFLTDPVDELWLGAAEFEDKPLVSAARRGQARLRGRARRTPRRSEQQEEFGICLLVLRAKLQEDVKEVRLSSRLTSSPACLVADEHDLTPRMAKMLRGDRARRRRRSKRILELNPPHPLLPKLHAIAERDRTDPRSHDYAELLYGQAHLAEGGELPDPAAFSKALADVMLRAV